MFFDGFKFVFGGNEWVGNYILIFFFYKEDRNGGRRILRLVCFVFWRMIDGIEDRSFLDWKER